MRLKKTTEWNLQILPIDVYYTTERSIILWNGKITNLG